MAEKVTVSASRIRPGGASRYRIGSRICLPHRAQHEQRQAQPDDEIERPLGHRKTARSGRIDCPGAPQPRDASRDRAYAARITAGSPPAAPAAGSRRRSRSWPTYREAPAAAGERMNEDKRKAAERPSDPAGQRREPGVRKLPPVRRSSRSPSRRGPRPPAIQASAPRARPSWQLPRSAGGTSASEACWLRCRARI